MSQALLGAPSLITGSGVSEAEIRRAEEVIGPLPHDYREFLGEYGWAMFGGTAIWGLGDGFPYVKSFVQLTSEERIAFGLPANLVAFSNNGAGDILCFKASTGADSPLSVYVHLHETQTVSVVSTSFSNYMVERITVETKLA